MKSKSRWRARRIVTTLGLTVLALGAGIFGWGYSRLEGSLALLEGEAPLPGLSAPVSVERDGLGVPTIRGDNRRDVARALGWVHAQERFFQMDLLRRQAAGELAALFGPELVPVDRSRRLHQMRSRASRVVEAAAADERTLLDAYTEGVNAGLSALAAPPFEYSVTGARPIPWKPEDSVLAMFAMFFVLNDEDGQAESSLGVLYDLFPQEVADFLTPRGTEWDAPITGEPIPTPAPPSAERFDVRRAEGARTSASAAPGGQDESEWAGSNNWAVAGWRTAHGGALLANDMHLELAVPHIWFRAALTWPEGERQRRVVGVSLPGTPGIAAGSTGDIAWGFTNSFGDWVDLVIVETDPRDPASYRTPDGLKAFDVHTEAIEVKGGEPIAMEIRSTIWGPVVDQDHLGRPRAVRWIAHDVEGVNLRLFQLERARSVEDAIELANRTGIPPQNFVCADREGNIVWTIIGSIPRRVGHDGRLPSSWSDGSRGWDGWLPPSQYPRVVNPPSGLIWTANARVVDGEMLSTIGDGGYAFGARARQIRDDLLALERPAEADMLAVQLDDRAILLERWRTLLLETLSREGKSSAPRREELRRVVDDSWTGRASVEGAAFRSVRAFRLAVFEDVYGALTERCRKAYPRFQITDINQWEGPLWRLVTEKPLHFLPPRYDDWQDALLAAADRVVSDLSATTGPLADRTWGERNTLQMRHPLSRAMPLLSRWLDMPREVLPGESHMPRVQSPSSGASERFAVSPGREESGIFHMPGGQSGHPLSPFYRAGHEAWVRGEPAPFLPGETVHRLTLVPSQ
jgi:penicillin amidase